MNYGGYNLVVKVLDCDSENTGSSPVTHPHIYIQFVYQIYLYTVHLATQ